MALRSLYSSAVLALVARPATTAPTIRFMLTALLILLIASCSANAQKGADKKDKEAKIKALEQEIRQLRENEKADLKRIEERYEHIIQHLEPKEVHKQLEEALQTLHQVHEIISVGDFDYGGHRHAAQESTKAAEHQLKKALEHDTAEERARAGKDLRAAHVDLQEALEFSIKKYGLGDGKKGGEPETRAAANKQLVEALPQIENAHHLLAAVDHEIKDFKQEKHDLLAKRDEEKKQAKGQYAAQIKQVEEQIKSLKK